MQSILAFFRSFFRKLKNLLSGNGWTDEPGFVVYYGCPNSRQAKALQLEKKSRG